MTAPLGKKVPVGNEVEWRIMQIMALFVHGGIHKLQNILIHIQLLVYFPVLFISPSVQFWAQTAIYLLAVCACDRLLWEHTGVVLAVCSVFTPVTCLHDLFSDPFMLLCCK